MFRNISSKALSSVVLVLIVCYGFFKILVLQFYSKIILTIFDVLGINSSELILKLERFSKAPDQVKGILGWLIYYPSYFLLHILFIFLLFHKQKRTRNYLVIGLSGLIFFLIVMSITGKLFGIQPLYIVSYEAFQKLFGLPFILLFIEGGRILYKDVMNVNSPS